MHEPMWNLLRWCRKMVLCRDDKKTSQLRINFPRMQHVILQPRLSSKKSQYIFYFFFSPRTLQFFILFLFSFFFWYSSQFIFYLSSSFTKSFSRTTRWQNFKWQSFRKTLYHSWPFIVPLWTNKFSIVESMKTGPCWPTLPPISRSFIA